MRKKKKHILLVSKHNSNREKQVILLMRGISSKNNGDFYCLNCLHSFRTKNKLESHKEYVKMKIFVI